MFHGATYSYESEHLTSVKLAGEETAPWKFKYDEAHQLIEMTDGRGGVTKTEYDGENRVKKQTNPMERVLKFAYGESGGHKTTTITEPNGSTTSGRLRTRSAARWKWSALTAQASPGKRPTNTAKPMCRSKLSTPSATRRLISTTQKATGFMEKDAEENEWEWTYNSTHDVETETTPRGEKTTCKHDAYGNVEAIERPAPGETTQKATFKYTEYGDLESATDPLGNETKYEYDSYGDLKAEIDPEGNKTTWTYNEAGWQLSEVSPRGNEEGAKPEEFETTVERDKQGRPTLVTDPLERKTKYAYDKNGNLESVTDANNHATTYSYNANDERTEVEAPNEDTTKVAYDSMGAVKSRTDGNGNTTTFEHDALGQLTEEEDPVERVTSYEYDDAGNLEKVEDALERTITYDYDEADRLVEVDYSNEATEDVTYEYDKDGNVVKMLDSSGTTTRTYDQLGRLTKVVNGRSEVVEYDTDLRNRQTEMVYPNGEPVEREFDKAGRMTSVTDWLGNETTFKYNADSQIEATSFPEGTANVDEYTYSPAGELSEISMNRGEEVLASMTYARDGIGQIETIEEEGFPEVPEYEYAYDAKDR